MLAMREESGGAAQVLALRERVAVVAEDASQPELVRQTARDVLRRVDGVC
jgi:hypothetical protein